MEPRIVEIESRKFVGRSVKMSLADNRTGQLWGSFMPRRKEIVNPVSTDLFSLQVYSAEYFEEFDVKREFEKWALVEVPDFNAVPGGMETFECPGGMYAVFLYKGLGGDPAVFEYIFSRWLPLSPYRLDHRPHFEVLGEKYKNGSADSEEEIWIPIARR